LVGDAQGFDSAGFNIVFPQNLIGHFQLGFPDLFGVVLYPARLRIVLGKFFLVYADHGGLRIEEKGT